MKTLPINSPDQLDDRMRALAPMTGVACGGAGG